MYRKFCSQSFDSKRSSHYPQKGAGGQLHSTLQLTTGVIQPVYDVLENRAASAHVSDKSNINQISMKGSIVKTRNLQLSNQTFSNLSALLLGMALVSLPAVAATTDKNKQGELPRGIFAKVGDTSITLLDYRNALAGEASSRFYHGKPKDADIALFKHDIVDKLVTDAMLVEEAKRRKLKPDSGFVEHELQKYDQRFANNPDWAKSRARVMPELKVRFENESLRNELEKAVRNVPPPSENQLKAYYDAHHDKFTPPPQQKVSVIVLRVDPGAPDSDWQKAQEQAEDLVKRIRAGEDFAKLAKEYSGDRTAEAGGDMGYLHAGMMPGKPEEVVGKLQPGETSDPVRLMEGITIFKLTDRITPGINSFESSKQRATELLTEEQSEVAWNSLVSALKKKTPVVINKKYYHPDQTSTAAGDGAQPPKQNQ